MRPSSGRFRIVLVTTPNVSEAERIAEILVKKSLAACVNIVPKILSVYRWEGKVERGGGALMIVKTEKKRLAALKKKVKKLHSYDVPEIVVLKIDGGDADYLNWMATVLK